MVTEWDFIEAEQYCDSVRDGTHDSPKFVDQGYPLITSKNIKEGRIDNRSVSFISLRDYEEINKRSKVEQWDVLISMIGTVGEVCLVEDEQPSFAIKNLGLFKCKSELDGRWLFYWLRSPKSLNYVRERLRGTSQQYISLGELRKLPVLQPKDDAIKVRLLDTIRPYDDLIETNRRRIALLEEAARLLYREWFVNLRFPGHEQSKMVDGLPEGWERRNLYDVADLTMGFPFQASLFNSEQIGKVAVRIRDIQDVTPGTWTTEDPGSTDYEVQRGDFLIGMDGMFHMNHWIGEPAWLVQRVCRVRPKDNLYWGFLAHALYQPIKHFEATISGATVAHLGAKHLKSIDLLMPSPQLKDALLSLNDLLQQKINLMEENAVAVRARDELLPKLMSGEIQV